MLLAKGMKDPETIKRFIELRTEGWSLTHISRELKVHRNTLIKWTSRFMIQIQKLHAAELEALAEQLIKRREDRARDLARQLHQIEAELHTRSVKDLSTPRLYIIADALRRQVLREVTPLTTAAPAPCAHSPIGDDQGLDYEEAIQHEQRESAARGQRKEELARHYGLSPEDCRRIEEHAAGRASSNLVATPAPDFSNLSQPTENKK